jgi:phosphoglycolate phosphatase
MIKYIHVTPRSFMRGIIFDLDGTLLNTVPDLTIASNAMLAHFGYGPITQGQVMAFLGHGLGELVRNALPKSARIPVSEALNVFNSEYARVYRDQTEPYSGIPALIRSLRLMGIPLAVVSNKSQAFLDGLVALHFPDHPFCAVIGERADLPRKPDPLGLLTAAQAMGTSAHETVLVGDTEVDVQAARNAGMGIIGVDWGFRPVEALQQAGVSVILSHPQEMLELIAGYAIIK